MSPSSRYPLPSHALLSTGLFLLLGLLLLRQSRRAPVGDYANYYYASRLWVQGQFDAGVYDPYTFNQAVSRLSMEPAFVNYTPVPPVSVVVYLPFALIEGAGPSKTVFSLLGLLLFCLAYLRLARLLNLDGRWWLLMVPFLCFTPMLNNFHQGQSYFWLLAFLMEGFGQWQKGRKAPAAMLWAAPIALKLFPAILLLFLLVEKDWRSLLLTIVFGTVLSLLPIAFFSPSITLDYFLEIAPRLSRGEINDPFSMLFQSGRALLLKAFVQDQHLNPQPIAHLPRLAFAGQIAYQAAVLATAALLMQAKQANPFSRFALAFLAGLLFTGYSSSYSMLLLLLPLLALPALIGENKARQAAGWLLIALAANMPVYLLREWPLALQFPRLYALLALLALLVWAIQPKARPATLGLIAFLIIGKGLASSPLFPTEGDYYLPDGRYGIIHDYLPDDGGLKIWHFNERGSQTSTFLSRDSIHFLPELRIEAGQVFWKERQLTFSEGQKRCPALLNGRYLVYLSDEGRGVGFYTLRKIQLPWLTSEGLSQ